MLPLYHWAVAPVHYAVHDVVNTVHYVVGNVASTRTPRGA